MTSPERKQIAKTVWSRGQVREREEVILEKVTGCNPARSSSLVPMTIRTSLCSLVLHTRFLCDQAHVGPPASMPITLTLSMKLQEFYAVLYTPSLLHASDLLSGVPSFPLVCLVTSDISLSITFSGKFSLTLPPLLSWSCVLCC